MVEGRRWLAVASLVAAAFSGGGAQAGEKNGFTTEVVKVHRETGMASFYRGTGKTASGSTDHTGMTAAHRKLPFGSKVRVRDLRTGREVVVTINDRGPFRPSRVIDLSHRAAKELGIVDRGIAKVELVAER